jgi:hypothetical protein
MTRLHDKRKPEKPPQSVRPKCVTGAEAIPILPAQMASLKELQERVNPLLRRFEQLKESL